MVLYSQFAKTAPISKFTTSGSVLSKPVSLDFSSHRPPFRVAVTAAEPVADRQKVKGSGQRAYRAFVGLSTPLLGLLLGATVQAQQVTPPTQPETTIAPSAQDLAKSVHNPFEDFIKVPIESDTAFSIGPHHNTGESLNVEPLLPFRLSAEWDLIVQPNVTVTYQPSPHEAYGLEDLQTSLFLTPHGADKWLWGIGPLFQFPTATATDLGTGRWSAGPTAAFIYSRGPWFNSILAYHLMSFAGNRDRGSVNQTFIEPQLSYNFESGWYLDSNPSITFDWTADAADGWTVPMGADVGKAFSFGSQAMSLQGGAYYFIERPSGTPQWMIRVQGTLLFPTK